MSSPTEMPSLPASQRPSPTSSSPAPVLNKGTRVILRSNDERYSIVVMANGDVLIFFEGLLWHTIYDDEFLVAR